MMRLPFTYFLLGVLPLEGALVSLTAEGTISQAVDEGTDLGNPDDAFRLSISYRSDLEDEDSTSFFGQYFDDELVTTLEFIESGEVIRGVGGSVNITTRFGPDGSTFVSEILFLADLQDVGSLFLHLEMMRV